MPFVAREGDEIITPEQASDDAKITCVECGEELRVRKRHKRDGEIVERHFWHANGGKNCSGGESETHLRTKGIVLQKLEEFFSVKESGFEREFGRNIADVYVLFEETHEKYGNGVVCEVQYKNEGKDKLRVSRNYLRTGMSVCWVEPVSGDEKEIELSEPEWYYVDKLEEYNQGVFEEEIKGFTFDPPTSQTYTCPTCPMELVQEQGVEHGYHPHSTVYRCPQCDSYYIEEGRDIERVPHTGNLDFNTRHSSW